MKVSSAAGLFVLSFSTAVDAFAVIVQKGGRNLSARGAAPLPLVDYRSDPRGMEIISSSLVVSDAVGILKNVAVGVIGIAVVLAAVAALFSSVIIPAAAEQLEIQAKELDPELWETYQDKLEPNEVIAMRPDLMQELGNKVQELSLARFETLAKKVESQQEASSQDAAKGAPSQPGVLDAEVVSDKEKD